VPYCAGCGKELSAGNFCPRCGKPTWSPRPAVRQYSLPRYAFPAAPPADISYPSTSAALPRRSKVPVLPVLTCACICALSMGAVVASSFLPWVSYSGINVGGLRRGGRLLFVLGVLGIIFATVAAVTRSRWPFGIQMVLGVAVTSVMATNIIDITRTAGLSLSNTGAGLFLGAAAGILVVVTAAVGSSLRSSPPP
jgi:hypothetical protein